MAMAKIHNIYMYVVRHSDNVINPIMKRTACRQVLWWSLIACNDTMHNSIDVMTNGSLANVVPVAITPGIMAVSNMA